jgi:hypothetical protein
VQQSVDFSNYQTFDVNPNANAPDVQNVQQVSTVDSQTITRDRGQQRTLTQHFAYPLTIDYAFVQNADGSYSQITTTDQKDLVRQSLGTNGFGTDFSQLNNEVHATDTRNFDSGLNSVGNTGSKSWQTYVLKDGRGACYGRTISAAAQVLVSVDDGADCK